MRALVGCECSGVVRRALRALGHDAWSCDIKPAEDNDPHHIQDDVLRVLNRDWDLGVFHPDCTFLTNAGVRWLFKGGKAPRLSDGSRESLTLSNRDEERYQEQCTLVARVMGLPLDAEFKFDFKTGFIKVTPQKKPEA